MSLAAMSLRSTKRTRAPFISAPRFLSMQLTDDGIEHLCEYPFAKTHGRAFKFDLALLPQMLVAVEIEGGIWRRGGGAHSHPSGILRDMEKYNLAALLGWRVLRFTTEQALDGRACAFVKRVVALTVGPF